MDAHSSMAPDPTSDFSNVRVCSALILYVLWTLRGYGDNEQYSISKSIKQYKIGAEQTRTSKTSEVGSGALAE